MRAVTGRDKTWITNLVTFIGAAIYAGLCQPIGILLLSVAIDHFQPPTLDVDCAATYSLTSR